MKELDVETLRDVFIRCSENRAYNAVIVFATLKDAREFSFKLLEHHNIDTSIPGIRRIYTNNPKIEFINDSKIELVSLSSALSINRCNEIIICRDVDIPNEFIYNTLQDKIVPYMHFERTSERIMERPSERIMERLRRHKQREELLQRSEELDCFLNSFSILE